MTPHEWDGKTYDAISKPLELNGRDMLERLELRGDETVIDAGCGSGRVTEALVERLPNGHVIGVDGSAGMIDAARERLGNDVELIVSDLCELDLGGRQVDAVFSTAVFHWLPDHERLFKHLHSLLVGGGQLVAQCGGTGNVAELDAAIHAVETRNAYREYLDGWWPWNYVSAEETATRLTRAGFSEVSTELVQAPAPYDELLGWLRTNALSAHQLRVPEELREDFVQDVYAEMDEEVGVSYMRVNIDARA
jgi:trans-aconitate 2-methyltransferase